MGIKNLLKSPPLYIFLFEVYKVCAGIPCPTNPNLREVSCASSQILRKLLPTRILRMLVKKGISCSTKAILQNILPTPILILLILFVIVRSRGKWGTLDHLGRFTFVLEHGGFIFVCITQFVGLFGCFTIVDIFENKVIRCYLSLMFAINSYMEEEDEPSPNGDLEGGVGLRDGGGLNQSPVLPSPVLLDRPLPQRMVVGASDAADTSDDSEVQRRRKLRLLEGKLAAIKPRTSVVHDKWTSLSLGFSTKAECMSECLRFLKRKYKADNARVNKAFQTLLVYVGNVPKNPNEERMIRLSNPSFQGRVGSLEGGIEFLELCGFERIERDGDEFLFLPQDKVDMTILNSAGCVLNSAITNPYFGLFSKE